MMWGWEVRVPQSITIFICRIEYADQGGNENEFANEKLDRKHERQVRVTIAGQD